MRPIDILKSPLAALRRLRSAPSQDDGPAPYRTIELRLPAELEGPLQHVKAQQESRFAEQGYPEVNLSDESVILSCIAGMDNSFRVMAEAGLSPDPKVH